MKSRSRLLLESLNWKGGDFISNHGYYYGLINNKLMFLTSDHSPFILKTHLDKFQSEYHDNSYIINGIVYRIPTLIELQSIIKYHETSHLLYITGIPFELLISDHFGYYYHTVNENIQKNDLMTSYMIKALLINSIDLNTI